MADGKIRNPDKYSRIFNFDTLTQYCPRKIAPTDLDFMLHNQMGLVDGEPHRFAIDNDGIVMWCELKDWTYQWSKISYGARWFWQSVVKGARKGKQFAVLLQHETPIGRQIEAVKDIVGFQVMGANGDGTFEVLKPMGKEAWPRWINMFFGRNKDWKPYPQRGI